jgi:alpha-tubulin suppressor-like RCC1 family protein
MPPTVSAFYFGVGVAAEVPYPDGWVEVGPQPPVRVGGTQAYTATVRDASGAVVTGETVTWSISDTTVATVDASGVVHGVAAGTATLSATTATRPAGITAQVTVTAAIAFASLAAGHQHVCGLESGGQAWCWGFNGHGRLGVGATLGAYLVPTAVQQPAGVAFAQLSAGGSHTCAVTGGGQAWCWGNNVDGRLGDGTTTNRNTPAAVQHPTGVTVTQLGVGVEHTCALDTGGQAWCWGQNGDGQLGDSTTTARTAPVAVRQPAGVAFTAIRAGGYHSCGLTSAGQAWCWGRNGSGQLGDSTTTMRTAPVAVKQPAGVTLQGLSAGYRHTCGVTPLGQAWCWGQNAAGQLGNNATANRRFPVQVQQGALALLAIAAGYDHTCAVASSGAGWCWGANARGQLGDWTTTGQLVPVAVLQPAGITFIAAGAGEEFSCALGGGQSFCWGKNANGQLGDSTRVDRSYPAAARH